MRYLILILLAAVLALGACKAKPELDARAYWQDGPGIDTGFGEYEARSPFVLDEEEARSPQPPPPRPNARTEPEAPDGAPWGLLISVGVFLVLLAGGGVWLLMRKPKP